MRSLYFVAILLTLTGICCGQKETLTREEVIAAIGRFDDGWQNKNAGVVDSILSPAYTYYTQSGGTFDRANVLKTASSANYTLQSFQRKTYEINIDGNTAVVNTTWHGKGIYFDTPFNDFQRCSITLVKTKGRLRIIAEHCTPIK
jgi:hypothetical protein